MCPPRLAWVFGLLLAAWPETAFSGGTVEKLTAMFGVDPRDESRSERTGRRWVRYGDQGLDLGSPEGRFSGRVNVRSQLRFSSPFRSAPRSAGDFDRPADRDFRFRRARIKASGHVGAPWLRYQYEQSLVNGQLLDLRLEAGPEWLRLRAGQWKVDYNRERMDSSGELQLVERSIVNRVFTVDRQKGVMLAGRAGRGTAADSTYYAGLFTGQGRSFFRETITPVHDRRRTPLWTLRYQWNALGGGVDHSEGDLARSRRPRLSVAVATAGVRSRYTRFSSNGGGRLDGFEAGRPGQYAIRQQMAETAFLYRGFSFQQEWHRKRIRDHATGRRTVLHGGYMQAGYFPHEAWRRIPKPLELAARLAYVDEESSPAARARRETRFAANWFLNGHADKLTVDAGRYRVRRAGGATDAAWSVRVQWDVTF